MDSNDRRYKERFATLNFVHYTLDNAENGTIQSMGRTLDASELGLLIQAPEALDVGQKLTLSIGLGEDILEIDGKVVHCVEDEEGMSRAGVEFVAMSAEQHQRLRSYLQAFKR